MILPKLNIFATTLVHFQNFKGFNTGTCRNDTYRTRREQLPTTVKSIVMQ